MFAALLAWLMSPAVLAALWLGLNREMSTRIAADEPVRHLIAQPVTGSGQHLYVLWKQSHLFMQLSEHGLLGIFAPVNATLRELPRMGANAFAPENLILLVEQDDADIGPKAVPVKHNQTPNF